MNPREFDKVYTIQYIVSAKNGIATNQKNYFTGYPFLRTIKPKAISVSNVINSTINLDSYLSLSNEKKEYVLFNYPISDLNLSSFYPKGKLRLFKINGVDLLNSYWIYVGNTPFSVFVDTKIFDINFYY
jgi:hypothetical protein